MSDYATALAALLPLLRQHDVRRFECEDFCIDLAPAKPVQAEAATVKQAARATVDPLRDLFIHEQVA